MGMQNCCMRRIAKNFGVLMKSRKPLNCEIDYLAIYRGKFILSERINSNIAIKISSHITNFSEITWRCSFWRSSWNRYQVRTLEHERKVLSLNGRLYISIVKRSMKGSTRKFGNEQNGENVQRSVYKTLSKVSFMNLSFWFPQVLHKKKSEANGNFISPTQG